MELVLRWYTVVALRDEGGGSCSCGEVVGVPQGKEMATFHFEDHFRLRDAAHMVQYTVGPGFQGGHEMRASAAQGHHLGE